MTRTWRVLALSPAPREVLAGFLGDPPGGHAWELVLPSARTADAVLEAAPGVELVIGDYGHALKMGQHLLDAAPGLCFLQQPAAGVNVVDLAAMATAGVPVANTGSANTVSVAEWTVLAALAMLRSTIEADDAVRAGGWPQLDLPLRELSGAAVGILGMGRIGQASAERFAALGARVSYWSRHAKPELPYEYLGLAELLAGSDIVVGVLPSAPDTRGLIDADALAAMKTDACLVNAGRGDLVDEAALAQALHEGRLGAAALDVFATEPLPADSPLRGAPRLLLAPHNAGASIQARLRILAAVQDNMARAVTGQAVRDVVNDADPVVRPR